MSTKAKSTPPNQAATTQTNEPPQTATPPVEPTAAAAEPTQDAVATPPPAAAADSPLTAIANAEATLALETERNAMREQLRQANLTLAANGELSKLKARTPELIMSAIKSKIIFDEVTHQPTNIAELVSQAAATFPEQFGAEQTVPSIDAGARQPAAAALTRDSLSKMTPQQIAKLDWEQVKDALQKG